MSATDYLDSLNWGVADAGAYSAEDTATLGTDRVDRREPPTSYHWSALQSSRMRQLLTLMSAHFKGGSRAQILPVTANPFSSGEMGVWVDSSASNALKYFNGTTNTTLGAGGGGSTLAASYAGGASQTDSTFLLDSTRLGIRIRDNASPITGDLFAVQNSAGTVTPFGVRRTGVSVSSTVETSGTVLPIFRITPAAHTGMTASTEYSILAESGGATHQWATGALSSQRFHKLFQHTIAFVGASTVTDAANLWLQGAPSAGTNATLTNSWALWVGSGDSLFQRDSTGSTIGTSALTIAQRDPATIGVQKYSPMLRWFGSGWDADNSVSRTYEVGAQLVPIQGNTVTGALAFYSRLDGGSWTQTEVNGNGYQGMSDQSALGAASTSSTTYVDVGNGSSTGFATWTAPAATVTKTYMLRVNVRTYMSTVGTTATTYFQVLQDGAAIGGHPTNSNKAPVGIAGTTYNMCTFEVPVTQTAGTAHVYKLQWKVGDAGATANVTTGVGTLQMVIEG